MNPLVVLCTLVVAGVEAMPQATFGAGGQVAVPQAIAVPQAQNNFPGFFFAHPGGLPSQFIQFQTPFLTQSPGVAGQPPTTQQIIPVTSFVVRPLSEAEQNTLAHQEFHRIWEAQAVRNLAFAPRKSATSSVAQAAASPAAQTTALTSAPAASVPVSAPFTSNAF